ncbi:hypothetical protein PHLGIDRAFT_102486 [Phlebiopsis gigantea 11061_1 CR5-6]|uniref:Mur ligase central domain-containing protein n=1 Tax=Phlebiopsis gigantea (strain 11061_1 CR5-6) TaxID=745531 RepID=A0A0C3SB36_PHLG1|nr:hypothetical protein PHLGIDRAFT_102486 [Phlebiopsis gigantea 11061_1 CR5-6]
MSIDLSLERIRRLLSHLPPYTRPTCHIAGTNGKGSVSALLSSIFSASSYSVGRFNSPHLVSVHDCIALNGEPVSPSMYAVMRRRVEEADREHATGCSSFELLTLTALQVFEQASVDIVVLEVGMGGRLDATNVVPDECVLISALTAVDLDHQAFLGNTVREIAQEKAAIAKPHKPFVFGPQNPSHSKVVKQVVRERVERVQGKLFPVILPTKRGCAATLDGHDHFPRLKDADVVNVLLPLQGEHQLANLGTAITVVSALLQGTPHELEFPLKITAATVSQGIQSTRWPGRLSFHTVTPPHPTTSAPDQRLLVLADGAHNAASAATLAAFLDEVLEGVTRPLDNENDAPAPRGRTLTLTYLLALSHSPPKTPAQTLTPLLAHARDVPDPRVRLVTRVGLLEFSPPEGMPWVRPVPPATIRDAVRGLLPDAEIWTADDPEASGEEQLGSALAWAAGRQRADAGAGGRVEGEGVVVIAGSLYLVADFYRMLQRQKMTEV